MNTTQKLTKTATALGLTVSQEFTNLVARDSAGDVRLSAQIIDGRFYGGFTVDFMGHVTSHDTVREMVEFAR